ncbi:MAG: PAS domain S-box protein [Gammaproteobacteria bacterium]|nr:PAS domain S-box protein [Gammaproteobacteria bacterium]
MNLFSSFRDAPIKRKLLLIGLLTSALALFSISIILAARGWVDWRARMVSDMSTYADVIGTNATTALLFDDRNSALETLSALSANPDIVDAVIYDKGGKEFARFIVPQHSRDSPMPLLKPGSYQFSLNQLVVSEPIQFKGDILGSIYLESDLRGLYAGLLRDIGLTFLVALIVFIASIFLFARMQKVIVDPILEMVNGMLRVSEKQDYAVRVAVSSKDEVGMLAGTFNEMLEGIQLRDAELAQHKRRLEGEVTQRTAALGVANQQLEKELAERRQAQQELHDSEERFRKAFQYSAVGMALVGLDGRWIKVNDSLCQIVGYPEQELLSKTFQDITHPVDLQTDLGFLKQLLAGEIDHYQMEKRYIHKDSHVVWIRLSVSLIRDTQNNPIHFVSQIDDITERKLAEQKIRQLNEGLEIVVQERTQQLLMAQEELVRKEKLAVLGQVAGSVGHELRNPLGVMSNAVYFLQTVLPDADESVKEYLNIIKSEIAGSERIVSDLLDSVRTKPPHVETVGVRELLVQTLRKLSIPSSVEVKLDIPDNLPFLRVDTMQINQVFRNLVSNGVEAMPEGGILKIQGEADETEKTVTVSVRDTGIGMTPEQLGKLFQPLFTTKARGIGLGLVVVKNLTRANGGTVEVQSEAGKGTMFSVTLPADQS